MLKDFYRQNRVKARLDNLHNDIVIGCKACKGAGIAKTKMVLPKTQNILKLDEVIVDTLKDCDCVKQYKKLSAYIISGLMEDLWDVNAKLRPDRNKLIWDKIKHYSRKFKDARKNGYGLFLYGDVGVGKTTMMAYVLNHVLNNGMTAHYIPMRELLPLLRKIYNQAEGYQDTQGFIEEIQACDFIAIDEVGKISSTDFVIHEFENFLRNRMNDKKPTLLASNFDVNTIAATYNVYIADIIRGYMGVFELVGKSKRIKHIRRQKEEFFE